MSSYTENLGLLGYGDGKVVLPAPEVQLAWNPSFRGFEDGEFRFGLVVGLEPSPDDLGWKQVDADSYRLEITPDLGWANQESMFEAYAHEDIDRGNARLTIIPGLVVGTDLVVQSDSTVIYDASLVAMKRILAPGFDRYLWRVRAVSPEGHLGHSSEIQSFRGRVVVASMAWSINPWETPSRSAVAVITGGRENSVASIEVNGDAGFASFPTPNTWRLDVPLGGGRNTLFLRAFDTQGNGSEYRTVEIEVTSKELTLSNLFNRFDDFGFKMGLERLPGERNLNYRERIKDVLQHRGSPTYAGLMNAIGRELDLTYYDQALLVKPAVNPGTSERWRNVIMWLTPRHFCVRRMDFVAKHEYQEVEGRTWQVRPDHVADGPNFTIETEPGVPVSPKDYHVECDEDGPFVQFLKPDFAGKKVYLSYSYVQRISTVGRTVTSVVADLNALEVNSKPVLEVVIDASLPAGALAEGLQQFPPALLGNGPYITAGLVETDDCPVRWLPAQLFSLSDREFKWRFKNEHGSQFGTEFAGWAYRLKRSLKTTWGYALADDSVWSSPQMSISGAGALDLVYDPFRGRWVSTLAPLYRLSTSEAAFRGYTDPRDGSLLIYEGLPHQWFWAGIGDGYDLFALVDESDVSTEGDASEFKEVLQVVEGTLPAFEDLGVGATAVDSASEVA